MKDNSKRFWSYVKHRKQDSSGIAPLKKADGLLYSDAPTQADILNQQFHSVYTREDTGNIPSKGLSPHTFMAKITVSTNGVKKLLRGLNINKATGPDQIPTREPVSYSWHQNFDIIMDACEEYARRWAKKEDVEVDTLSEWIKSIADVLKRRIRRLKHSVNTRHESIFSDPDVVRELSRLHENFVIVPADKASNNYTFVCKRHYVSILSDELGFNSLPGNPTYNLTDLSASEVLDNHKSVLTSFGIETSDDELDLPYIYWIPKMHKIPYKHRFIAGSSKCSTKPLSILLTKLLTHIKQGLQKYCETADSRSGINQMWILKNSKEL